MSTGAALLVLAAAALGTYVARSSLILLLADRSLPVGVERALANVGPRRARRLDDQLGGR